MGRGCEQRVSQTKFQLTNKQEILAQNGKKRNKNLVFRTPVILESTEGERNYDSFRVESILSFLTEMRLRFDIWTHRIYRRRFYKFDALNFT